MVHERTLVQTLCTYCTGSGVCAGFTVGISSIVMRPYLDSATGTCYASSAGIVMSFAI